MTMPSQLASQQTCQPASQPASQLASQPASQWSQPSNQPASQPAKQPASQRASQTAGQPARQPAASQPAHRRVDDWSGQSRTASALQFMVLGVSSSCSAPSRCFRIAAVSLVLKSGAQVHALRFRGGLLEVPHNMSVRSHFGTTSCSPQAGCCQPHGGAAHLPQRCLKQRLPSGSGMGNLRRNKSHGGVPPHNLAAFYETTGTRQCVPARYRHHDQHGVAAVSCSDAAGLKPVPA